MRRKKRRTGILRKSLRTCNAPRCISSKTFRARCLPPTFAGAATAARPFMDLFPRASKNTFSNRDFIDEVRIFATGCAPRRRGCAKQKSSRHNCSGPQGVGAFTDFFVICTGYSTPQVQAICTEIEEQLHKNMGRSPEHREGHRSAEWA